MISDHMMVSPSPLWQLPSANDWLVAAAEFPTTAPRALFDYWTIPALLRRWWPPEVENVARVDGGYHFSWPGRGRNLRGYYTAFEPGKMLSFTWKWDSEPDLAPIRHVIVTFETLAEGGTQITIIHGPYAESRDDQEERMGHLEGWTHFLGRLQGLLLSEESA
ncbi:MAG TPA: SRPBCC domain-containing protein [Ktedonobacterales bacterium]|jgi:uncharacterized protein YndB with AHSA1/START domain